MSDLAKLNLEGHVKAAKKKTAKAAPKKAVNSKADDGRGIPTKADTAPATESAKPVEVATKKTAPKSKAKKADAPAVPIAATASAKPKPLGKSAVATLTALSTKGKLTRGQIAEAIGIGSGFTSLLGHLDPAKREPQSLSARGLIAPETTDAGTVVWVITAAGAKALAEAKK